MPGATISSRGSLGGLHAGHNVTHWRDADVDATSGGLGRLLAEKHFRIDGHKDLWALVALLGRDLKAGTGTSQRGESSLLSAALPTFN